MNCVVCGASLETFEHEGITFQHCAAGHGVWCSGDQLREAAERFPAQSAEDRQVALATGHAIKIADVAEAVRACPVCAKPMQKVDYAFESGVLVDSCWDHGVWLDVGELERIESWVEANHAQASAEMQQWAASYREDRPVDEQRPVSMPSIPQMIGANFVLQELGAFVPLGPPN